MDKEYREIRAVHERDLNNVFEKLGIKIQFEKGEFKCKFCKQKITHLNLYSIFPESGNINFVCDVSACVVAFAKYNAEKYRNFRD